MPAEPPAYLGLEIGGTKLQLVAGTGSAEILERRRFDVDLGQGAQGIRDCIRRALPGLVALWQPGALVVGFGGPVDWRTGRIARSHQVEGWSNFDLKGWLEPLAGIAVGVDNDANLAALGEATVGAGKGANPMFYVTLGSGVGGGLVVDGRLYHGATPGEAEIGHLRLDRQGTIVESRCSGWAVDARIRQVRNTVPTSLLARLTSGLERGEAKLLGQALAGNDPEASQILAETAENLAFALSHVVHLVHPERVVLGGGLALLGEPLREQVAWRLPGFIMEVFRPGPDVRLAALGEVAVPAGCLVAASQLAS